jgi:hypothetical protein
MTKDEYADTPETAPVVARGKSAIRATEAKALRRSPQFKRMKSEFRAACSRKRWPDGGVGEPCWLCGDKIDYRLDYPHPYSWSLDHAITVKENPGLVMDPLNFRSSHLDCNIGRGTDDPKMDIGTPSETW